VGDDATHRVWADEHEAGKKDQEHSAADMAACPSATGQEQESDAKEACAWDRQQPAHRIREGNDIRRIDSSFCCHHFRYDYQHDPKSDQEHSDPRAPSHGSSSG
jgi:hypothetical protein